MEKTNNFRQGGCVFGSSPKWRQGLHPQLVHQWLLVHSGQVDGGLDQWVLMPFAPPVVPLSGTCSGSSIIEYGLLLQLESLMHDQDPSSFCYKHAQVASTTTLVYYCTCFKTRPLGLCAGQRTRMFLPQPHNTADVDKYKNSRQVPNVIWIVQDDHNNWLLLVSVREMNKFTEISKSPHFSSSAKRLH